MISHRVSFIALFSSVLCVSLAWAAPVFTCYAVQRGDTAARIALRVTKDANNAYAPWFQILDPAASAFIPKSQYNRIHPGWQACIDDQVFRPTPPAPTRPGVVAAAHVLPGPILGWMWAPVLFLATALGWIATRNYLERRQAASRALERFGTSFIREFERPLLQQPGGESPLRSRLRLLPQRDGVEIWLAPNEGWHYPNLSDHRRNVEYDVERIVTLFGEHRFVCGRLATQGPWVVIPFRLEGSLWREEP
jgi:hypothetical protein